MQSTSTRGPRPAEEDEGGWGEDGPEDEEDEEDEDPAAAARPTADGALEATLPRTLAGERAAVHMG